MLSSLTRWRSLAFLVALLTAVVVGTSACHTTSAAVDVELARDLGMVDPAQVGISAERLERLDAGMQAMVEDGKLAGVATMLARHGKVVFTDAAGKLDVSKDAPVEFDSIFRIYSMTKPVVGVAMMMLHEEGKWQLNDPVSKYIPAFMDLKVYTGQDAEGEMEVEDIERGKRITVRDLMKHTAGLGYTLNPRHPVHQGVPGQPGARLQRAAPDDDRQAGGGCRWSRSRRPCGLTARRSTCRAIWSSSSPGNRWASSCRSGIFGPLGMVDTAFYVPSDKTDRVAAIHAPSQDSGLTPTYTGRRATRTSSPAGPSGGGGLYGTAPDYIRFAQMLLNEGELNGVRLLSPRSIEMMRTNHLTDVEQATYRRPGQGWGLDFSVVIDSAASGQSWSTGSYYWIGIAGTWFWVDPELDLTFVGMIQHNGGAISEVQ